MSSSKFQIKVTPVRNRKPKVQPVNQESKHFADQLLDVLQNPLINRLETPDLFVSVIASAVKDLSR